MIVRKMIEHFTRDVAVVAAPWAAAAVAEAHQQTFAHGFYGVAFLVALGAMLYDCVLGLWSGVQEGVAAHTAFRRLRAWEKKYGRKCLCRWQRDTQAVKHCALHNPNRLVSREDTCD